MANTVHLNIGCAPVLVYSPAVSGTPVAFIYNEGTVPVWLGQNGLTITNGVLLQPGDHHKAVNATQSFYACTNWSATTAATQPTSAAVNAGGTTLTSTIAQGAIAAGSALLIGTSGSGGEVVTLVSGGGTTTLTVTALQYDHRTGITPQILTQTIGQLSVQYGTG